MVIREVQDRDFVQLAEMRWTHAVEDDETYGEHNTDGVTKSVFIEEFVAFLYTNKGYKIFVAEDENAKILSAMFVYLIPTAAEKMPTGRRQGHRLFARQRGEIQKGQRSRHRGGPLRRSARQRGGYDVC